jgi:hypothetical protein
MEDSMQAHRLILGSSSLAIVNLALVIPLAEATLSAYGSNRIAAPAPGVLFPIAFSVLVSSMFALIVTILVRSKRESETTAHFA